MTRPGIEPRSPEGVHIKRKKFKSHILNSKVLDLELKILDSKLLPLHVQQSHFQIQ